MFPYGECVGEAPIPGMPCDEGGSVAVEDVDTHEGPKHCMVFFHGPDERQMTAHHIEHMARAWVWCLSHAGFDPPFDISAAAICINTRYLSAGRLRGLAIIPGSRARNIGLREIGFIARGGRMLIDEVFVRLQSQPAWLDIPLTFITLLPI